MNILSDLKMYGRFIWGLRGFLKQTLTLEEAKAIIKKRMEERETNFLRLVRRGIFGYPKSPYLPLLKLAQCEMGDIENMVRAKGLEGTLQALREAGVYITFEEFKGREPMVRNGKLIPVKTHDFDNPYLNAFYYSKSGGTTGPGTRVAIDLEHLAAQVPNIMISHDCHGALNLPTAIWFPIPPDSTALISILYRARFGQTPQKWFSPITNQHIRPSLVNYLIPRSFVGLGRLYGVPIPSPEFVPMDQAAVIANWASKSLMASEKCLILCHVSQALRVCVYAQEKGIDLSGTFFWSGGEPPTPVKINEIARTGAHLIPMYIFTEVGYVGVGCSNPADCNDIHLFKDLLALTQYFRRQTDANIPAGSFHFTTLLPTAPKILLNVESDDYGIVEKRACSCPMESYGFTEHLREIRSFRKLTGEGVTLIGSEMIHILEELLPARFGGTSLNYQLVEEEDERGFTRLSLFISPRVGKINEEVVIDTVLKALERSGVSANLARAIWSQTKTLRVRRMEPIFTNRGKLMPLHLMKKSENSEKNGEVS